MFDKLRRARADLAAMNALLPAAERIARDEGIDQPNAEHLLLASLELDDDIAHDSLRAVGVDPVEFRMAIAGQHEEALRSIGVIADDDAISSALPVGGPSRGPYRSQGSLQTAFQRAVDLARHDGAALNSGYVLLAVTEAERGTIARVLEHLGVDRALLRDRVRQFIVHESSAERSDC